MINRAILGYSIFRKRAYPKKVRRFAALLLPSADGYGIMGDTWYHRYP